MRFCLVVPEEFYTHYNQFPFEISGLLNWARVLQGDVRTINAGDLADYDTYMTNVSSTETEYISVLRQLNPAARIIACFDYGFDVVNQYFNEMSRVKQVMERADIVFSVNKNQVKWMRLLLSKKETHYIPHPTDIENILKFRREPGERDANAVCAMWHQYDNYQIQMLEVLRAVERKLKRELHKVLVGIKPRIMAEQGIKIPTASMPIISEQYPDADMRGKPLDPGLQQVLIRTPKGIGWDSVMPYLGVDGWYHTLSRYRVALDLYTVNSIGRFGMDCAGVGVPCVASNKQDSSKLLWPFTVVDPYDPEPAVAFVSKLLTNKDFYTKCEDVALRNLRHFGFEESRKRMMEVLRLA